MSWQATAWAEKQKTGSASRKVLLLVLANYADDRGVCWPSQQTLAKGCEQSVDTIHRNAQRLELDGLLKMEKVQRRSGQWPRVRYHLLMPVTDPQNAVRQKSNRDDTANDTANGEQEGAHVRIGQSADNADRPIRTSNGHRSAQLCGMNLHLNLQNNIQNEPSCAREGQTPAVEVAKPQEVTRTKSEPIQVLQNRIVHELGYSDVQKGWLIFGDLTDKERRELLDHARDGSLSDGLVNEYRSRIAIRGRNR